MSPTQPFSERVLVCHHLEVFALGLASLLREGKKFSDVIAATTVGEIVESLERGVSLIVLGSPYLSLFESASDEDFHRGISQSRPKVVMLSSDVDENLVNEASAQGIDAVIDARQSADVIVSEIFSILHSETKATGVFSFRHWKLVNHNDDLSLVCRDETDERIISLIIQGFSNEEIAEQTFSALQTVRNRISRLLSAAGAKNRTQLAVMFSQRSESSIERTQY